MTLEQAKQASVILQKIDDKSEIINNLKFKKTYDIRFGKGNNESGFIILDKEIVDILVNHILFFLEEELLLLNKQLENL
jgi:hypothetical protein